MYRPATTDPIQSTGIVQNIYTAKLSINSEVAKSGFKRRKEAMLSAAIHIPPKLLALESSLLTCKWPAYRFTSPWDATKLYSEAYIIHFRSTFGMSPQFDVLPGTAGFSTLWRMRQAADLWAMPYDEFLRIAFSMNRRNPVPYTHPHDRFSNLHQNKNFQRKIRNNRERLESMTLSDDMGPQYWVDAFAGLPSQTQFRSDAIETARATRTWRRTVHNHMIRRQYLPDDLLRDEVDNRLTLALADELKRVRLEKQIAPLVRPTVERHDLWQSCFGVPGATRAVKSPCFACPAEANCLKASDIISRAASSR